MKIEIKKIKRIYCVVAGRSVLGKFRTLAAAEKSLADDVELYRYWAGSAGVSVDNSPATIVAI